MSSLAGDELLVTSRFTDEVLLYDPDGNSLGVFASGGGLDNPVGLTFGPDGNLYVASGDNDLVLRYDGTSGAFLDVFASGGGLDAPRQLNFGPDGDLLVASGATNEILRYDGASGAFLGVFASGGNLSGPTSFTFGPTGDLFVASVLNDRVKRYDGTSGLYLGNFVTQSVNGPHDVAFGPDGLLYVTNAFTTRIQRFDGATGAFLGTFVNDPALSAPLGMTWDGEGRLCVANQGQDEVRRYDGTTGAFLGSLVVPGAGGLDAPLFLTSVPDRAGWRVQPPFPGTPGGPNWLRVTGARPGRALLLLLAERPGRLATGPCGPGFRLLLPSVSFPCIADESGNALVLTSVAPALAGRRFFLQAWAPGTCDSTAILVARL